MKHSLIAAVVLLTVFEASGEAGKQTLKIINWNVLYGFNHGRSIGEAVQWINQQEPDVAAFQELNGIPEEKLGDLASKWGHSHAVTHKEHGFPVGITSRKPIEILERRTDGFHHGFLHCKTYDIHFFVVHFWPGKAEEVREILDRTTPLVNQNKRVVILGDFNGCSRKDETFLNTSATLREKDYTFVDMVEAAGFIDLVHKHDPEAKISCPSPITIPEWSGDMAELKKKQYRIDFIFTDDRLGSESVSGTIALAAELNTISDHYPVIVELDMSNHR